LEEVKVQRKLQGESAGWRPIAKALSGKHPTRLVQHTLSALKKTDRIEKRKRLAALAEKVTVLAKEVIFAQDQMHLGRQDGQAVEAQVLKDRGTLGHPGVFVGPVAKSEDVVMLLKAVKEKKGKLPLVFQSDNGPAYVGDPLKRYLKQERVVHLKSRTYRPTDNGAAEHGIGELRAATGLGRGVKLESSLQAGEKVLHAIRKLDRYRLRGSRGFATAKELAQKMGSWYPKVDREGFYWEVQAALQQAVLGLEDDRARKAERDAIYNALEKYGLITWSRGGGSKPEPKRERIL